MTWTMILVEDAAKIARACEDEYETLIARFPFASRTSEQQASIDAALLQSIKANQAYRAIILKDPDWHPMRRYPTPGDYRTC